MKFKIGDLVKCIDSNGLQPENKPDKNEVYIITGTIYSGNNISINNPGCELLQYMSKRFIHTMTWEDA